MALTPEMEAATESPGFVEFAALKIEFPDKTVRLVDGSATLILDGETYTGVDDDYGVWVSAEDITDGADAEAPRFRFGLKVPGAAKAQALIGADRQDAPVSLFTGIVDQITGLVLPGYETPFVGFFDVANRKADVGDDVVECDCYSIFELFFEVTEGVRLSGSWLKARYPGALGLDHISDVERALPWGVGGAGTAFKGSKAGDYDWRKGTPLAQAFDRAMGGLGLLSDPAAQWRWSLSHQW